MAMDDVVSVAIVMMPEWLDFLYMSGAFLLVATGALVWIFFFRKTRRRKRKHRHRHRSSALNDAVSLTDEPPPEPPGERSSGPAPTP